MAKRPDAPVLLPKGAEVVLRVDLREAPQGTTGKVQLIVGLSWVRYLVAFDNGVSVGSLGRNKLATPLEWRRFLSGDDEAENGGASGDEEDEASGGADDDGGYMHNGTLVPQLLIDRAKAARQRLAA